MGACRPQNRRRIRVHIAFAALRAVFVNDTFFLYILFVRCQSCVRMPAPTYVSPAYTHRHHTENTKIIFSCHVTYSLVVFSEFRYDAEWCACSAHRQRCRRCLCRRDCRQPYHRWRWQRYALSSFVPKSPSKSAYSASHLFPWRFLFSLTFSMCSLCLSSHLSFIRYEYRDLFLRCRWSCAAIVPFA